MFAFWRARLCTQPPNFAETLQEWGKDSDDAVDGAGSVLSSGALVCRAPAARPVASHTTVRSARASTTWPLPGAKASKSLAGGTRHVAWRSCAV